ncbi:MAG TPA: hypothetical protein DFR83_01885 [Deltaproteobacteria bacterium]|nr:hypothetical protein [Deltaproteobacteria bacterium]
MDSSWWLHMGSVRMLIDPWLVGSEVDYFRWFNTQWHRTPPIEPKDLPDWDIVVITQKYPDHLHPETLRALNPTEVWAPGHTHATLKRLLPAARLVDPRRGPLLRAHLKVRWLESTRRLDPIYEGVVFDDGTVSIVLAPHGLQVTPAHQTIFQGISPCAALVVPLRRYALPTVLGGAVAPGAGNAKALLDLVNPAQVIPTHDEDKHGSGLIPRLAHITPFDPNHWPEIAERVRKLGNYAPITLGRSLPAPR